MSRFAVQYASKAKKDLQESYDWGVENWGQEEADDWVFQIDNLIGKHLSNIPLACPFAPENSDFDFELRQLVIHRYRILFRVLENNVFILRIRGPFSGQSLDLD